MQQAEGPLKVTVYDNKKELIEITFLKDKVFSAGIIRGQPTEIDRILLSIKNISGRDGIQVNHHVEAPLPIGVSLNKTNLLMHGHNLNNFLAYSSNKFITYNHYVSMASILNFEHDAVGKLTNKLNAHLF